MFGDESDDMLKIFWLQKILHAEDSLVSAEGIEPSTNGLKGRCSAIELRAQRYG